MGHHYFTRSVCLIKEKKAIKNYLDIILKRKKYTSKQKYARNRYKSHLNGARRRKIYNGLCKKAFKSIIVKNCCYCGKRGPNGVDRIDNNRGYYTANCVSCCWECNRIKGTLPLFELKQHMQLMIKHLNKIL